MLSIKKMKAVTAILKRRYTNLGADDAIELSSRIVEAIDEIDEEDRLAAPPEGEKQ